MECYPLGFKILKRPLRFLTMKMKGAVLYFTYFLMYIYYLSYLVIYLAILVD